MVVQSHHRKLLLHATDRGEGSCSGLRSGGIRGLRPRWRGLRPLRAGGSVPGGFAPLRGAPSVPGGGGSAPGGGGSAPFVDLRGAPPPPCGGRPLRGRPRGARPPPGGVGGRRPPASGRGRRPPPEHKCSGRRRAAGRLASSLGRQTIAVGMSGPWNNARHSRDSRDMDDDDDDDAGDAFEESEPQIDTSMKQVRASPLLGCRPAAILMRPPLPGDRRRRPSRCAGREARQAGQRHPQVLLAGAMPLAATQPNYHASHFGHTDVRLLLSR